VRTKRASNGFGLKAIDLTEGTFEAVVSVFGVVDRVGDRVMPGAFEGTLDRWKASGDPIPVVWSHAWDDVYAHIGAVLDAEERPAGLWVKARLDLDQHVAAQVFRLLAERRVREFSFAYDVLREKSAAGGANELLELDLIEVGPTLKGVNPATQLLATKSLPRMVTSPTATIIQIDTLGQQWKRIERRDAPLSPAGVLAALDRMEHA
jgi:HK97 family phage prohead protease